MPRFIKMWLFSALISFTAIGMYKGLDWYYNRDIEDETPIVVTAEELASIYQTDINLANSTYTGHNVIMSGVVTNMGSAGAYYTVNLKGDIYTIDLSFYDVDEIAKLNDISIGDAITISGNVEGLNLVYVSVSNCKIE